MTTREKIFGIVGLVILAVALFLGYEWFQEHDAAVEAQAKSAALETVRAENAQAIAAAKQEFAQASADQQRIAQNLQQQLAAIAAQRHTAPTPQQFVIDASKLISSLPTPLKVESVPATATAPATQQVVIPREDLAALQNYRLDCEANADKLTACQQTASDTGVKLLSLTTQLTRTESDYQAMTKDRDNWRTTVKGGTVWHHTLTAAKWIGIGAAVGYVAARNW